MDIIKVKIGEIIPYENNAKAHPVEQIDQIIESIKQFGFNDPLAIDENNVVIEGHGRLEALQKLGYEEVECIRLSHLTEEQKRAYILVHNKLTMNTGFDHAILAEELKTIEGIEMEDFGFFELPEMDIDAFLVDKQDEPKEEKSKEITCPHCGEVFEP